jgi:hypothetical protein
MNLSSGWIELSSALKEMRQLWDETRPIWDDAVRRDFEEHNWVPLESQAVATLRAIDRLAPTVVQVQRDCS